MEQLFKKAAVLDHQLTKLEFFVLPLSTYYLCIFILLICLLRRLEIENGNLQILARVNLKGIHRLFFFFFFTPEAF